MGADAKRAADASPGPFEGGWRWEDATWRFRVTTAGSGSGTFSMNWAIPLAEGGPADGPQETLLTSPAHAALLQAWRTVLWTLVTDSSDGAPRKGSISSKLSTGLRRLTPWMVATGRLDLGGLDRAGLKAYLATLTPSRVERDEDDGAERADARAGGDDGGAASDITAEAMTTYVAPFAWAYACRGALARASLPHAVEDPLSGASVLDVAKTLSTRVAQQTAELPDETFIAAVNAAASMLDEPWLEPLVALADLLPGLAASDQEARCREFASRELEVDPLEPPREVVRDAISRVRAACQTLVQSLSALRLSELCGIPAGERVGNAGLPGCVVLERTFDDEYELLLLDASLFKHTTSSEPATWVLGLRPTGSDYLPPPVRAIDVLERLDAGWRRMSGVGTLLISFTKASGLPLSADDVGEPLGGGVRRWQRLWMEERGCLSRDQRFHTHMWRKTFARYMIRVSSELLPAISHHLKHLSVAMTEVGYCRPDPGTRRLIEDARVEEAGSVILGVITGRTRIEGPVAAEIRQLGVELGRRFANRPPERIAEDVVAEVKERRIGLYGDDVGWCVFRGESARCHVLADDPTPALFRLAPAFARRGPEVCQGCRNFAIGDEHLGFWRARRSRLAKGLAATDPGSTALVACLERAVVRCDTVLGWMGEGGRDA